MPDSAGLSYVSVGSWQGSHFWLVQAGLLGLISQLAHHHFCYSPLAKANNKASQGPRDGEENRLSKVETASRIAKGRGSGMGGELGMIFMIGQPPFLSQIMRGSVENPSYTASHPLSYAWYSPSVKSEMWGVEFSLAFSEVSMWEK